MSVFLYKKEDTFIHGFDPRIKIAALAWFFLAAALSSDIASLAAVSVLLLVCFILSKTAASILKTGWMILLVGVMTFALWAAFYKGEPAGRAVFAGVMTLRFADMLLAGVLFLSITSVEDFSNGLMLLKLPYGAAFAVSLSFKLVSSFINTGFLIVEAQEVRGNDATRGNIIKRLKAYAPLLVPLILNGIKKAETLNLALESKGFSPKNKPDLSGRYKITTADTAAFLALAVSAAVFIAAKILN